MRTYKKSGTKKKGTRLELCGRKVLKTILKEREDAIYYSIISDATPDISHTEQNVLLIRYVL